MYKCTWYVGTHPKRRGPKRRGVARASLRRWPCQAAVTPAVQKKHPGSPMTRAASASAAGLRSRSGIYRLIVSVLSTGSRALLSQPKVYFKQAHTSPNLYSWFAPICVITLIGNGESTETSLKNTRSSTKYLHCPSLRDLLPSEFAYNVQRAPSAASLIQLRQLSSDSKCNSSVGPHI